MTSNGSGPKRLLFDVNVLLALVWPGHQQHQAVQVWFKKTGSQRWATNPLTQLGVLRLLTNAAVMHGPVSSERALQVIAGFTKHQGHKYWPLDHDLLPGLTGISNSIRGHRQWTDAALLLHAVHQKGVLVTLDQGIQSLAGEFVGNLITLPSV